MKKIIILLAAAILLCAPASRADFRYAPVIGFNITNLKFHQDLVQIQSMPSAQAGIECELMFPGLGFGMDFGLIYNQLGAKVNLGERRIWAVDGFGKPTVLLHTFQVPLHLRFKWTRMNGLEDYIAPFVYGGPEFTILAFHNKVTGNPGVANPFKYTGGDLGLNVGGGFELLRRWQVSFQYTWGMTYLLKTVKLDNYSARSRQLSVRVAYYF